MANEKNKQYWADRLDEIAQRQFDVSYADMSRELQKVYDDMLVVLTKKIESLKLKMLEEGVSENDIWTYARFRGLLKEIQLNVMELGGQEVAILQRSLEEAITKVYAGTQVPVIAAGTAAAFTIIDPVIARQLVARAWSSKHFESTVWDNKEQLVTLLKTGIANSIILGESKDKTVARIAEATGKGFRASDRVVRTELMHTINTGQIQKYKDSGYKELEVLITDDDRLCETGSCDGHKEGDKLPIDSKEIPPFHPNCRCTVIPVLE